MDATPFNYTSPTLTFNGNANFKWDNPSLTQGFGDSENPLPLAQVPKGTFTLRGKGTPKIGRSAGINFQLTSDPQGTPSQVRVNLTFDYGDQRLEGTLTGTLDTAVQNGTQVSMGFKAGNLDMTHTPSKFKVQVTAQGVPGQEAQFQGSIKKADGTKVADIGRAKDLGLPDLGSAKIVKYTDNTFETLESILPRSRMSRR